MNAEKPWNLEPDFVKWIDPVTGLVCAIVRVKTLGHLCGYVRVPNSRLVKRMRQRERRIIGLAFSGRNVRRSGYTLPEIDNIAVHGGVTFSGRHGHYRMSRGYWVGFDCAHFGDLSPGLRLVSFVGVYRDMAYVRGQCESLAKQLKELLNG